MRIRRAEADEALIAVDLSLESRAAAGNLIPPPAHDADDTRRWMRDDVMPRAELWFAVDRHDTPLALLALEGDDWLEQLYDGSGNEERAPDVRYQWMPRAHHPLDHSQPLTPAG